MSASPLLRLSPLLVAPLLTRYVVILLLAFGVMRREAPQ
jgi:hypothetical protein